MCEGSAPALLAAAGRVPAARDSRAGPVALLRDQCGPGPFQRRAVAIFIKFY